MPKFVGGCADGQDIEVQKVGGRYPPVRYIVQPISFEEKQALHINYTTMWKSPEDVYYLCDGEYVFDRTVRYKP